MSISVNTKEAQLFIGGKWVESSSGHTFEVINPASGEAFATVPDANSEDVERAVKSAQKAFESRRWHSIPPLERGRVLRKVAELIRKHQQELAQIMTRENGMPINMATFVEIPMAADCFDFFASLVVQPQGEVVPFSLSAPSEHLAWTMREPIGIAGLITPWNFPLLMPAWKIAPALAAGCPSILKPAPETPLTALKLAELCKEAGVPDGMLHILTGKDEAGKTIVSHPDIPKIAFTGETTTGKHILQSAAENIKRVTLELGGKSPNIIFEDADLDEAARSALFGIFYNSGQVCQAGSRILVHESVYDEFLEKLVARAKKLTVGPGTEMKNNLGPVISKEQYEKILNYIEIGKCEGATLLCGGNVPEEQKEGYFIEPTVFSDVSSSMRIAREEIFGPVVGVIPFKDDDEAVQIANDTIYGLAAAVWTRDIKRGLRMAQRVKSGTLWLNTYQVLSPTMPFGGYKQSGIGRESGIQALHNFLETKSVIADLNERTITLF
ncbi:aldehyde dehydrogenase family protein [Pueribacillus sp. YX66]|uniref:aldehyde dehydrogenase family protein n=1 Tax=Pueribacillus sp. YX66 TaxID=3229242 RepID=UPI00358D4388